MDWRHANRPKVREARQNRASAARTLANGLYDDIMVLCDSFGHRGDVWSIVMTFALTVANHSPIVTSWGERIALGKKYEKS